MITSLNLTIKHGQHVIITGPNGCGKSSLFRLLGELWPLYAGRLVKPRPKELFYIPQKPYLTLGTFRDQIIYPHSVRDMHRKNVTDLDLMYILSKVELSYLLERETFDTVQDWTEVLSGGEKQRVTCNVFETSHMNVLRSIGCHCQADLSQAFVCDSGRMYKRRCS